MLWREGIRGRLGEGYSGRSACIGPKKAQLYQGEPQLALEIGLFRGRVLPQIEFKYSLGNSFLNVKLDAFHFLKLIIAVDNKVGREDIYCRYEIDVT